MKFDLNAYTVPLRRTPKLLRVIFADLPDSWLDSRHASEVFSPRHALAHLVICEAETWVTRLRYALEPHKTFTSGTEINQTSAEYSAVRTIDELLNEFEALRLGAVQDLESLGLTEADLESICPDEEIGDFTVGELLATWPAHDLYHIGQIFKSFSSQYQGKIGSFQQFLNLPHFN